MVQPLVAGWRGATRRTFPVVVAGDRVTHIAVTTRYHGEQMSSESLAMCPKSALCRLTVGKHKPVRASTSVLRMQSCQANPENLYAIYVLSITVQLLLLIVKKMSKKICHVTYSIHCPKSYPIHKISSFAAAVNDIMIIESTIKQCKVDCRF